ncbi:alpha/beta fold hydrolase [Sinorhizobium medicae]|nr:alpha/beta fold hydrolase [Sinorhizobium medicae]
MVFSHGWPLTADVWDPQMVFFASKGYRVVAHDRRSHGRSDQVWDNNTMDQYADDLAELIEALDLRDVILVGHSTGGGEVTRFIGRHGTGRVAKVALIGAVPPLMLKTEANPGGLPIDVFDGIRKGTYDNRSQFFRDLVTPFYGYNREGAVISEGIRESFWLQGMMGGLKGHLDSIRAFSESNFNADLAKFDKPTLVLPGDDDQIVPIGASAHSTVKIVRHAVLKVYEGADHGLTQTYQDRFNADLLKFIEI